MGAHESTRMAAAKKMVRSGRADMHRAAELCGVSYNSLHASITREDRMSGKRSYCGHCAHYREDAPNAPEGICLRSRKPDSPPTLSSFERVRFGEQTGRKPFCPFRGVNL